VPGRRALANARAGCYFEAVEAARAMITLNGKDVDLRGAGTIGELLEAQGFVWPLLIVRVNGALVQRERYANTPIAEGDTVDVIHMMSGG
jgi:sulfur carrier protein